MKRARCSTRVFFALAVALAVDYVKAARGRGEVHTKEASFRRPSIGLIKFANLANRTQASITAVSAVAAGVVADAELGSGLVVQATALKGGPATLEEYCKGGGAAKVEEGAKVEAEWKNMGTNYPGVVKDENKDGTVDIEYDDGFVEKSVKLKRVDPIDSGSSADDPGNDPACQLVDFVSMVKQMVDDAYKNIAAWLAAAKMKQEKKQPPTFEPPTTTAPPAAPLTGNETQPTNDQLEQLKKKLAERDGRIAKLEKQVSANDKEILEEMGLATDDNSSSGIKTIEDLIREYIEKIENRDKIIKELEDRLQEQHEQLFAMGARMVDLSTINDQVMNISALCDEARAKRANLEKEGKMDDELGLSLDKIFETEQKLRKKVGALMALDRANKAKTAKGESDAAGDEEMMKAALEVEKDLKGVQETTKHLDEGLHPHGEKWWRYRYEHSYVEAVLMVLISIIMFIWERGYHFLRRQVYNRAAHSAKDASMTHGTMYIHWLEYCAGELMVCLMAFLTVWLLAKFDAFDLLPRILARSDKLHLPHSGTEYRRLAIDISVVLFFAVLFYYFLILAVVHQTTKKLAEWAKGEERKALVDTQDLGHSAAGLGMAFGRRTSIAISSEYLSLKHYFVNNVQRDPALLQLIQSESDGKPFDANNFPFWAYLRLNVRNTVDNLFMFGWTVWILIVLSFMAFCVLHRVMHMGYIRIMMVYAVALVVILVAMMLWVKKINQLVSMHTDDPNFNPNDHAPRFMRDYWVEGHVCHVLHYVLFFLCYGASRMICQPWMWELHFWPVLGLTIFTVVIAILFVVFFAPMIPVFAAAMALPPFVDGDNLALLHDTHSLDAQTADKFVTQTADK